MLADFWTYKKPFDVDDTPFLTDTFMGRVRQMLTFVDPSQLLYTKQTIFEYGDTMRKVREGGRSAASDMSDHELWRRKLIYESATNGDELVMRPCRMSGFVVYNGPVCVGAMLAQTTPAILFWHFINQTQNAAVNFFNSPPGQSLPTSTLLSAYVAACGSAVGVAFGSAQLIRKTVSDAALRTRLLRFVAFPASCAAGAANCFFMRRHELTAGVDVAIPGADGKPGAVVGKSQRAAYEGLRDTIISRMILPMPTFLIPPALMMLPPVARFAAASKFRSVAVPAVFLLMAFQVGLPHAIALFPQRATLPINRLEADLRAKVPAGVEWVSYNKGL
eukprot:TRINITY_DN11272_c0_g2_i1.p1 TRINITY_DN11272_c0_g2~~TRINITY_DN11272_c0_g2_i1.p1  ORF type:complete len:333 (-),score=71.65 TRINITY_DN11272_c0_g2_i1:153-1151(-)